MYVLCVKKLGKVLLSEIGKAYKDNFWSIYLSVLDERGHLILCWYPETVCSMLLFDH